MAGSRAEAARQTRARVIQSAHALFIARGYGATTIRAVAEHAGVSVETVYKTFAGKAGLLKAAYDVSLAGDDRPLTMADRPDIQAVLAETTGSGAALGYAQLSMSFAQRVGSLITTALQAKGTDPDLQAFLDTVDQERLVGAQAFARHWSGAGLLQPHLDPASAADTLWILTSPAILDLATSRGWSQDQHMRWLADILQRCLFRSTPPPEDSRPDGGEIRRAPHGETPT